MKKIAVTLVFIISTVLFGIGAGINASAAEAEALEAQAEEASLQNEIATINTELESDETDVVSELNEQKQYYQTLYSQTSDTEEKEKINRLIETTQELIDEYEQYMNPIQTRGSFHLIYTPAVAAVTAYFNNKGYKLAAELLTHAKDNDDLDSIYVPVNRDIMYQSSVFMEIVNGTSSYGTSAFPDEGGTVQKDLYNAIHSFYYSRSESGRVVVIQDRYDFAKGGYSSIAGIAVDTMHAAQNAGTIVPFISVCTFDFTGREAKNQTGTLYIGSNARYTEEIVTLGKGEYKEFETKFSTSGYKVIQTFGNQDAYLYLYDAAGNLLASNDDGGYKLNALIYKYLYANTTYKIRVRFFNNSVRSGVLKLAITPSYGALKSDKTTLVNYEDIYNTTSSNFTFSTFAYQGYSRLITFSPSSKKTYTIETESDIDTYLYLVDPRSTYKMKSTTDTTDVPCVYNDDGGTSLNAKITKQLAKDIPYMIVYSRYSIGTSGTPEFKLRIH